MTFGDKVIGFCQQLDIDVALPPGIRVMNPFRDHPEAEKVIRQFYGKFYHDHANRIMILGINPGRHGAGTTGIPFTDTKRLQEQCGIRLDGFRTHEPSSVFVYDVIEAFGGTAAFYGQFYIGAVSPLGFMTLSKKGTLVNCNYYDSQELMEATRKFIVESLKKQLAFGIIRDVCFCLGTGKNAKFLQELNAQYRFFESIIALEHPRYIMQYRAKTKEAFVLKYVTFFNDAIKSYLPS